MANGKYRANELTTLPSSTRNGWERLVAVRSDESHFYIIARKNGGWGCSCPAWVWQTPSKRKGKGAKGAIIGAKVHKKDGALRRPCKHLRRLWARKTPSRLVGMVWNEEAVGHLIAD